MNLREIREHLLPAVERETGFAEYLRRLSYPGLQILAVVEMAVPLLMFFGRIAVSSEPGGESRTLQTVAMVAVGAATLALSATTWSRAHARVLAAISAWLAPTLLMWSSLYKAEKSGTDEYILMGITLVVLTVVAVVPLLPWHALALGFSVELMYILCCSVAARWEITSIRSNSEAHHIFLVLLTLLATGISVTNYSHRRAEHEANVKAVQVAERLASAQLRAQLAENAIGIGKMAATLSHEINSPLGTILSAVGTLTALSDRLTQASPEERARLEQTRAELSRSIEESAARIDDVTRRLRRFVGLAEAELKSADLNDLVSDVAMLHDEELQSRNIELECDLEKSLPPLTCRPQLLSAVFSSLLSNAIEAIRHDGRISIRTHTNNGNVIVTVQDNGRGMSPDTLDGIFDPSFKVDGRRVSGGNWSLFNSRQIVYEHGGEIRVETRRGSGTAVHVSLPTNIGRILEPTG